MQETSRLLPATEELLVGFGNRFRLATPLALRTPIVRVGRKWIFNIKTTFLRASVAGSG
jgi:hypothetical protein